jgi:hypothetical protein
VCVPVVAYYDLNMKACVYIKKARRGRGRGQCLSLVKHCLGEGRSVREIDDGQSRVAGVLMSGLAGQPDKTNPRSMRDNLLRLNHAGKSKEMAKHIVISIEDTIDPAARRAAVRVLRRMAFQFLKAYAPGCASLAFIHTDRKHPHLHLIVANSNGERSIHWTPNMIRQMQSMTWLSRDLSTLVESGRKSHRRAVHDAYPHARLSLAAELAALPAADLEKISWVQRGSTRVFMYKDRRIREKTIEKERKKLYEHTPTNANDARIKHAPPIVIARSQPTDSEGANRVEKIINSIGVSRPGTDAGGDDITAIAQSLKRFRRQRLAGYATPEIRIVTGLH